MRLPKDVIYARPQARDLLWLLDHVESCAQVLEWTRAALTADTGLDRPTRRLLEILAELGPQTVPRLATMLCVTRQAVQPRVDRLRVADKVELLPNAKKRRSPLVRLTAAGLAQVEELHARERRAVEAMARRFLAVHVTLTRQTLANLIYALSGGRAWQMPQLRAGYADFYGKTIDDDWATRLGPSEDWLLRHPIDGAGFVR